MLLIKRPLLGLMATFWLLSAFSVPGAAHAYLQSSEPPLGAVLTAPPEQIQLNYSEAIEPQFSSFTLYDSQGKKIEEPESDLSPDNLQVTLHPTLLKDGTHTLAWKVVSAVDGHLTKGTFPIAIGASAGALSVTGSETSAPPLNPVQAAIRWLQFLAAMALIGGFLFALLVLGPIKISSFVPQLQSTLKISLLVFIAASAADLLIQAMTLSESSIFQLFSKGTLFQLLVETRYGYVWLFKIALAIATGFWLLRRKSPDWGHVVLGAFLLLSLSLSSHSAALTGDASLAIFSDWGHLMAASFWVGGLLQFSLLLFAMRPMTAEERKNVLAQIAPRFYQLAFISAALVLLTGFHLTYRHMPNLDTALFATAYGEVYLIKHLVLLGLVLLAAANLIWVWPRSVAVSLRILRIEAVVAAVIVFFGGLLTLLPPAPQAAANEQTQAQNSAPILLVRPADELTVAVTISPGVVGLNRFDAYLTDHDGNSVADAQRVTFAFQFMDEDLGEVSSIAQAQGDGHYIAEGSFISLPGQWEIGVTARFAGRAEDVKTRLPVRIGGAAQSPDQDQNPLSEDVAKIEAGKLLYQEHCMSCHGESGHGDGPEAANLALKPADLIEHLKHHTDEQLLFVIQTGRLPVMQPFGAVLSEDEIGQIIAYVRALSEEQK